MIQPAGLAEVRWVSPIATDDFAEYRDAAFLDRLGLASHRDALADFWPKRGPQWDALGVAGTAVVLVEAKAHLREFNTPPSQAAEVSRRRIATAFDQVRAALHVTSGADWAEANYQFANRLAHLWWLRDRGVDAHLLFVGFLNDQDMNGPTHASDWHQAFASATEKLGLAAEHGLSPFIHHATPDVTELV
ncbi:hypothetical protein [Pseudooceanicola sp.]|uniref:hypothetical protein n=1 Tax=Pseudooceanicola sp. TaxID=1914328 RepID=UPI002632D2C7|nr:hypothetical protein [Pseudooceanicola sp.]MDF1853839.1 hypothetical protein [Pseudooceanicola sp.]